MPRGGSRPNSGPAKGSKQKPSKAALDKIAARELTRQMVTAHLTPLVNAQLLNAVGLTHLMLRNDDGTWRKASDDDDMAAVLNGDPNRYYISTKDPSIQAFTDLMNRALDKPKEQEQDVNANVRLLVGWQD